MTSCPASHPALRCGFDRRLSGITGPKREWRLTRDCTEQQRCRRRMPRGRRGRSRGVPRWIWRALLEGSSLPRLLSPFPCRAETESGEKDMQAARGLGAVRRRYAGGDRACHHTTQVRDDHALQHRISPGGGTAVGPQRAAPDPTRAAAIGTCPNCITAASRRIGWALSLLPLRRALRHEPVGRSRCRSLQSLSVTSLPLLSAALSTLLLITRANAELRAAPPRPYALTPLLSLQQNQNGQQKDRDRGRDVDGVSSCRCCR